MGQDLPTLEALDRPADLIEIVRDGQVLIVRKGRQVHGKVRGQLGTQGEVLLDVFLPPTELKPVRGGPTLQFHGNQDQGCLIGHIALMGIHPLQMPQGQVQDVDALLLDHGLGVTVQGQQAALQALGRQSGLESQVRAALGLVCILFRLRQADLRLLGRLVGILRGQEAHGLLLGHQQPVHLIAPLVHHMDQAADLACTGIDNRRLRVDRSISSCLLRSSSSRTPVLMVLP